TARPSNALIALPSSALAGTNETSPGGPLREHSRLVTPSRWEPPARHHFHSRSRRGGRGRGWSRLKHDDPQGQIRAQLSVVIYGWSRKLTRKGSARRSGPGSPAA